MYYVMYRLGEQGMAQWWERSPPTNVARVQIPASTPYVGWVCCWFSPLLREVFLRVLRFSLLLKNQHFQIPIRQGIKWTKNHFVDVLPLNHYLLLFIYLFTDYYQRLTLESSFINLEQNPLNRSQQLPAPYKRLVDERTAGKLTMWLTINDCLAVTIDGSKLNASMTLLVFRANNITAKQTDDQ